MSPLRVRVEVLLIVSTRVVGFQLMSPGLVHGSSAPMRLLSLTVLAARWLTGEKEKGSVAGVLEPVTEDDCWSVTFLPIPGWASPLTFAVFCRVMFPFDPR